jgi:hypothetical protein
MSIQYVNQSESLSWSFSDLSGGKWCLQRKYMCRQHGTLDCRKLHKQYQTRVTEVVKDMCDNWTFCKVFWPGMGFYFLIDIWGWVKIFLTFWWLDRKNFYQERHFFLFICPNPAFKNPLLIIYEGNTKKNHKRVVSLYVIETSLDLHKLWLWISRLTQRIFWKLYYFANELPRSIVFEAI